MTKYKIYERKRGKKDAPKMRLKDESDYPPKYKVHKRPRPRPSARRKPTQ